MTLPTADSDKTTNLLTLSSLSVAEHEQLIRLIHALLPLASSILTSQLSPKAKNAVDQLASYTHEQSLSMQILAQHHPESQTILERLQPSSRVLIAAIHATIAIIITQRISGVELPMKQPEESHESLPNWSPEEITKFTKHLQEEGLIPPTSKEEKQS